MSDRLIARADLSYIERHLSSLAMKIEQVDNRTAKMDQDIVSINSELQQLQNAFAAYMAAQKHANRVQQAETRLVQVRQKLSKQFGHYDVIRRTTTGILQATDIGIIHKAIINNVTEEMMLTTPGYWLAPCLVALSAWIDGKKELAEKAMLEGLKRDDEKTSLFFALICRRAGRRTACIRWVDRYLTKQDPEKLDRKAMVVLSAYVNGLWGNSLDSRIEDRIISWMQELCSKPGYIEAQEDIWKKAITQMCPQDAADHMDYPYLAKYSTNYADLVTIMNGARLHVKMDQYLKDIFAREDMKGTLKEQLDSILDAMVSEYDDEEIAFRKKEKFEQLVVDNDGDEDRARQQMDIAGKAFETHKDFIEILTLASLDPQETHPDPATQKLAISLSKDWIANAYRDVVAENRSRIPASVKYTVGPFSSETADGRNETEQISAFDNMVREAQQAAMNGTELTSSHMFCKNARFVLLGVGALMLFARSFALGIVCIIAGILCHTYYKSQKRAHDKAVQDCARMEEERGSGEQMIRAINAEVVDFRRQFRKEDAHAAEVLEFLAGLSPREFVKMGPDSMRRVSVKG